jgi:hypothetical protein
VNNLSPKLYHIYVCYTNITLYYVSHNDRYYPRFQVTAVGHGMYYAHIRGSTCTAICYLNSVSGHFPTVLMTSIRDRQPAGLLGVSCGPQIPGISSEIEIQKQIFEGGGMTTKYRIQEVTIALSSK